MDTGHDDSCSWSSTLCTREPITTKELASEYLKEIKPDHSFVFLRSVSDHEYLSAGHFEFECSKCMVTVSVGTEYTPLNSPRYNMTVMSHPNFEASCNMIAMQEALE